MVTLPPDEEVEVFEECKECKECKGGERRGRRIFTTGRGRGLTVQGGHLPECVIQ